jgi:hypothetical protein
MIAAKTDRTAGAIRIVLLLALLFVATADAVAERLPIKSYTTTEGLAHNRVKRIVQDSRGFLWFCTAAAAAGAEIAPQSRGGNGIISMQKRAAEMRGQFQIVSRKGEGTTSTLRVPVAL